MKRASLFLLALACMMALSGCSAPKRPFRELTGAEIRSASVQLSPPDLTVLIQDTDRLAELLQAVTLYEEAPSYSEYAGQAADFTLELEDGTQTTVSALSPFLILDGVGYRAEHDSCEALSRYASVLLEAEDAPLLLKEPPALTAVCGDTAAGALLGTYSWQWQAPSGSWEGIASDSAHPLDCQEFLLPLETEEETAVLRFQAEPGSITDVRCWSDAHWSDPGAETEPCAFDGSTLQLKPGGYIYEVTAQWDDSQGSCGTAHYAFYIRSGQSGLCGYPPADRSAT